MINTDNERFDDSESISVTMLIAITTTVVIAWRGGGFLRLRQLLHIIIPRGDGRRHEKTTCSSRFPSGKCDRSFLPPPRQYNINHTGKSTAITHRTRTSNPNPFVTPITIYLCYTYTVYLYYIYVTVARVRLSVVTWTSTAIHHHPSRCARFEITNRLLFVSVGRK